MLKVGHYCTPIHKIHKDSPKGAYPMVSFRQRHYYTRTKSVLDASTKIKISTLLGIDGSKENEIWWRHHNIPESELKIEKKAIEKKPSKTKPIEEKPLPKLTTAHAPEEALDIFDKKPKQKTKPSKPTPKKTTKTTIKKKSSKTSSVNEKFFNKVKSFLSKKLLELVDIIGFSRNELILKVKDSSGEKSYPRGCEPRHHLHRSFSGSYMPRYSA